MASSSVARDSVDLHADALQALSVRADSAIKKSKLPNRSPISALSMDILVLIFQEVYDSSCPHDDLTTDPLTQYRPQKGNLFCPPVFPNALASVCHVWKEAISSVSLFWTRLIIRVDRKTTPSSIIRLHLTLSAHKPLDIRICRHPKSLPDSPSLERTRVAVAMALLYPHIQRWRSLHINVLYSSSFSLPQLWLQRSAERLVDFRYEPRNSDEVPMTTDMDPLRAPALATLSLSGYAFCTSYLWLPFTLRTVTRLTISQYNQQSPGRFFVPDLVECLHALPNLKSVNLIDLDLDPATDAESLDTKFVLEHMKFEGINSAVLAEFYWMIDDWGPDQLELKRCTLPYSINLSRTFCLRFTDMLLGTLFSPVLAQWDGEDSSELIIVNCPSFDDTVLFGMSSAGDDGRWLCPKLDDLVIYDCPGCSSNQIRQMVEARREAYMKAGVSSFTSPDFVVAEINSLTIRGCGEPAREDMVWLDANLAYVDWDGLSGGYERSNSYVDPKDGTIYLQLAAVKGKKAIPLVLGRWATLLDPFNDEADDLV